MKKVLVGGCFDILHYGHIQFLTAAKKAGDYLVVMLESDENVRTLKGAHRPIHTQHERAALLKSLRMVDEVVELPPLAGYEEYMVWVKKIKPDRIAVTRGDPKIAFKQRQAKEIGATVVEVIDHMLHYSTSKIVENGKVK